MKALAAATVLLTVAAACSGEPPAAGPHDLDPQQVALGESVYQANCASCHRPDLSGDPNWRTPNQDGSYPPPPHDSSGHTWHHSDQVLARIIAEGTGFEHTRMPRFGEILSEEEIEAVIEFLKSKWGPEERAYQWQISEQETG